MTAGLGVPLANVSSNGGLGYGSNSLQASKPSRVLNNTFPSSLTNRPMAHSFQGSEYHQKARKLMDGLDALQATGAECANLEIPCIVVCGNQSAGKSSVMERVTGIPLPRAKGTCTKCPMVMRLSTAGSFWQCKIKLNITYDRNNKPLSQTKEELFCVVHDKEHLSQHILAAQRALLNPSKPANSFCVASASDDADLQSADGSMDSKDSTDSSAASLLQPPHIPSTESDELKFTRNKVVLEVTGADVDLSLNDLPGIIQTDADGNHEMVQLVQDLVRDSISNDRAIIVAAITCKDDIENQQVVRMAREADPEGLRTIGVLTKPDTIEDSDHEAWVRVLSGDRYPLRLGYYCVRNPTPKELEDNMSLEDAAAKESSFFSSKTEFASAPFAVQQRYGVQALREALSKELVVLAQRELPKLRKSVEDKLAKVSQLMRQLPPAPSMDPLAQLLELLSALSSKLSQAISGQGRDMDFYNRADKHFDAMAEGINSCRPATWLNPAAPEPDSASPSDHWLRPGRDGEHVITLERARALTDKYQGSQLPSFASYKVLDELIESSKGKWEVPIFECLQSVGDELMCYTAQLLMELFGRFSCAHNRIGSLLEDLHTQRLKETQECLERLLEMEYNLTHTRNKPQFITLNHNFMDMLVDHLCKESNLSDDDKATLVETLNNRGIPLQATNIIRVKAEAILEKQGHPAEVLRMIAGALAYYQLSSSRMVDNVDVHIKDRLLSSFSRSVAELPAKVAAHISSATAGISASGSQGINPAMSCMLDVTAQELMAEDSRIEAERQHLQGQIDRLKEVRKILVNF